jgi:outer membrane protein OmpA-like peptidoglycan-associated protein
MKVFQMHHPTSSTTPRALALVLALGFVTGCATQESIESKTDPLSARLAQLDQTVQASADSDRSLRDRLIAIEQHDRAQGAALEDLSASLAGLRDNLAHLDERLAQSNARATPAIERLREEARQADARIEGLAEGLRALTAGQPRDASERVGRVEAELGHLGATIQGMAAREQALAAGLGATDQRLDRTAADLAERLARVESRLDDVARMARRALEMAAQNDIRSHGKVAYTVTLTEDKTLYPINLQQLSAGDRKNLESLVQRIKAFDKEYHLEIQGHTDNIGADDYNYQLGRARAEVVKRYLHESAGIPLGWMSVISYGATQPVDAKSNNNRRIVIHMLVLDPDK